MAAIPDSWQYVQPENWAKSGEAHCRAADAIFVIFGNGCNPRCLIWRSNRWLTKKAQVEDWPKLFGLQNLDGWRQGWILTWKYTFMNNCHCHLNNRWSSPLNITATTHWHHMNMHFCPLFLFTIWGSVRPNIFVDFNLWNLIIYHIVNKLTSGFSSWPSLF